MKKYMQVVNKGIYKVKNSQDDDSNDQNESYVNCKETSKSSDDENDDSYDSNSFQQIKKFIISPNEQFIVIIREVSSYKDNFSPSFDNNLLEIISVKSNKIIFKTEIKKNIENDTWPCVFSQNSQYLICISNSKGIAINIPKKQQINLHIKAENIIQIDSNNCIKFRQDDFSIIYYSLDKKKIIKQSDFEVEEDFKLLDATKNELFIVKDEEFNAIKVNFELKTIKSIFLKQPHENDDIEYLDYKLLKNNLFFGFAGESEDSILSAYLLNFRSGKIIRSFYLNKRTITNYREKDNIQTYIYYLNQSNEFVPDFYRFNFITGINKQLLYQQYVSDDTKLILSENLCVCKDDDLLKYYNYRK